MAFDIGAVLKAVDPADIPDILRIFLKYKDVLGGLFGGKKEPPVIVKPGDTPTPKPVQPDPDFPDDNIPSPVPAGRKVTTVRCNLSRVQYNRSRFPNEYNHDNPFGLDHRKGEIQAGTANMAWGSKFWLDLTAYDQDGKEFFPDDVIAADLEYETEHHAGEAFIKGHGGDKGAPTPGYETNDTDEVGNGITAWVSSLGFLHQMKAHQDNTSFECWGKVGGVESNRFTIKVS